VLLCHAGGVEMKKITILMLVLLVSGFVYTEMVRPDLTVNGIMQGGESIVIVNDKVLKEGDMIEGAKVIKINDKDVEFQFEGEVFIVVLTEASTPKAPSNEIAMEQQDKLGGTATDESMKKRMLEKAKKYLSKATENETQAQNLDFGTNSIPKYDKIISLYASAIKNSRFALDKVSNKQKKDEIRENIRRLSSILSGVKEKRGILYKKIKHGLRDNKVVIGMKEKDVIKIKGRNPDKVTKNGRFKTIRYKKIETFGYYDYVFDEDYGILIRWN